MNEDQLQAKCFQWAHNTFPQLRFLLFAVPNGGFRNKIDAMKLKATGTIAGIPDLIYLHKSGPYGIEMKTEIGTVSSEQKRIHEIWTANGIKIYICRSFEQFQQIIAEIHAKDN